MSVIDLLIEDGLSLASAKNYERVYRNISDVRSPEAVDEYVAKKKKRIPQLTMLKRVMTLLEMNTDHLEPLFEKYSGERERTFVAPSPGQSSRWKSWPDILAIANTLNNIRNPTYDQLQTWIVAIIITHVAPLRNSSIRTLVVWDGTGDRPDNAIDIGKEILVLSNYKTSSLYGRKMYDLPPGFVSRLVAERHRFGVASKYLLTTKDGKRQMSASAMTTFLQDGALGMGSNTWRPVYISFLIDSGASTDTFKRAAQLMNHSVAEQQLTYSKFRGVTEKTEEPITTAERQASWRARKLEEDPTYFARKSKEYRERKKA